MATTIRLADGSDLQAARSVDDFAGAASCSRPERVRPESAASVLLSWRRAACVRASDEP
jgi:hypothetical protein